MGKKLKLEVKSDHIPFTDSILKQFLYNQFNSYFDNLTIVFFNYTDYFHLDKFTIFNRLTISYTLHWFDSLKQFLNNQFNNYFDNLTIVFFLTLTDHFHQDKFTTLNRLTIFQSSTLLQLEFYYQVNKLNNTSIKTIKEIIITAIQQIRSKSKQRVTFQRIFLIY